MMVDLKEYKSLYIKTAHEYVSKIKKNFSLLKENPANIPAVEEVYIAAHSLKSQSQIMNFREIANLCSQVEFIFKQIKESKNAVKTNLISLFDEVSAMLDDEMKAIENERPELSSATLCERFGSVLKSV